MSDPNFETDQLHSDEETEKLALATVEAIRRLISERHALRGHLVAKERELTHLRERFTLVRDSYRKLANELVTQLKLFESLEREPRIAGTYGTTQSPPRLAATESDAPISARLSSRTRIGTAALRNR
jgi:hypothetical protein